MKLYRKELVKYYGNCKDNWDKRKKHSVAIFSYIDKQGIEYRKGFYSEKNTPENNFWNIAPKIINQ